MEKKAGECLDTINKGRWCSEITDGEASYYSIKFAKT
jgi:hypothetical protein